MASDGWLQRADWARRTDDFDELREHDDGRPVVAMEYVPRDATTTETWLRLRDLWLDMSPHPHVVDALDGGDDGKLLLRYAAFDWNHPTLQLDANLRARVWLGEWAVQLTDAYMSILGQMTVADASLFRRPVVRIDLGGAARVGFLPVGAVEELDERTLVQVIGREMRRLSTRLNSNDARQIRSVIERCNDPNVNARYSTLTDLREAWTSVSGPEAVRAGEQLASWTLAEEGLGWLALRRPNRAIGLLEQALELDRPSRAATLGLEHAYEMLGVVDVHIDSTRIRTPSYALPTPRPRPDVADPERLPTVRWSEAHETGRTLEAQRGFVEARMLYQRTQLDGTNDVFIHTAQARCYLALAMARQAVDCAQQALAIRSNHIEALSIRARAYLVDHKYSDALNCTSAWLAADDNDASAHYAKGRALLGLARYLDARDAFDRASELRPDMLEAVLLRREVDRAAARVREEVGIQPTLEIELPSHLANLGPALANGRIDEIIVTIERPEYDTDAAAQLIRAQCLAFEGRWNDAVETYDRVTELSAQHGRDAAIGKAYALLALDQADGALALFDQLRAQHPSNLEPVEGRALALRRLGRLSEAEEAHSQYIAASGGRSALRTGLKR